MVVVNPHQYEANLSLVRAMTDDLGDVEGVDHLVEEYQGGTDRLAAAVGRLGVAAPSPDVAPLLIDAAFQGRHRELPSERQQAKAVNRMAQAGAEPAWVNLAEAGNDGPSAATGFQRVEMRVPDGLGMHTYIDIDATTYRPLYGIEILQLDPETGEHVGTHARPERTEFTDHKEWLAAIAEIKASVDD